MTYEFITFLVETKHLKRISSREGGFILALTPRWSLHHGRKGVAWQWTGKTWWQGHVFRCPYYIYIKGVESEQKVEYQASRHVPRNLKFPLPKASTTFPNSIASWRSNVQMQNTWGYISNTDQNNWFSYKDHTVIMLHLQINHGRAIGSDWKKLEYLWAVLLKRLSMSWSVLKQQCATQCLPWCCGPWFVVHDYTCTT